LLCLEGAVALKCPEPVELTAGDWIYIDRWQEHSMRAIEDSSLLMTIHFD
jgi:quercetin dioxygenase-like cupin family protein